MPSANVSCKAELLWGRASCDQAKSERACAPVKEAGFFVVRVKGEKLLALKHYLVQTL